MKNKFIKAITFLLIVFSFAFTSCPDPVEIVKEEPGEYENPYEGQSRDLTFSKNSGRYDSSFDLTITALGKDIYYTRDGSIPVPGKAGTTKYTGPISIVNRNNPVQARVLSATANHNRMFMNEGDPRGSLPAINTLTDAQVPKATVIRAIAVDSQGRKSEVLTRTYFVGTNAQLFGNTSVRVLSLVAEPADLISDEKGILVTGGVSKQWDGPIENQYNYRQRGIEWERAAAFELFDGSSKAPMISTNVGIRVRGGWSRGHGQKSLNVYFRSNSDLNGLAPGAGLTGINNFNKGTGTGEYNFELIPGAVKADGTPVSRTKSFMLRSGGNDAEQTKYRDVFIHDLLKGSSFTTQASAPVIVYLNGEYWGPYNMSERYSDNHTEYKYGVDRNLVISIDNGDLDDGNPGEDNEYWDVINGMISSGTFNKDRIDINSFVDYFAAQIYIYNEDWPHNNYVVWKTRSNVPGNTYGDTKWRYSLHDSEFSLGIYSSGSLTGQNNKGNVFNVIFNGDHSEHEHNQLLKKLLGPSGDAEFKEKFVNAILKLYNENFHPNNFDSKLTNYINLYRPLMGPDYVQVPGHYTRWGGWGFDDQSAEARRYLNNIRPAMLGYLSTYIDGVSASEIGVVTISSLGTNVSLTINGKSVSSGWSGAFYKTVSVTAPQAPSGYEFDGWAVTGGTAVTPSALTTTVNITSGNVSIAAKYKISGSTIINVTGISLNKTTLSVNAKNSETLIATVNPSNATYPDVSWSSSDTSIATVNQSGQVTGVKEGTATITVVSKVDSTKSATCTVTVLVFKFPGETIVGSYNAYQTNPYIDLSSTAPYEIVTISGKAGYIMKVSYPDKDLDQWEIAYKEFGEEYTGQEIRINFSSEIYRAGEAGPTNWQINNDGEWPSIGQIWGASESVWHNIYTGLDADSDGYVTPTDDNPRFYLSSWDEDGSNARTIFYIANYSFNVVSMGTSETIVSEHSAGSANTNSKFYMLTSDDVYQIVNIPGIGNVMKVNCNNQGSAVKYDLSSYEDKEISINFSVDVMRSGSSGQIHWQVPDSSGGYPTAGAVWDADENQWYTISGTIVVVPGIYEPRFYLTAYQDYQDNQNNSKPIPTYYINNFRIEITEASVYSTKIWSLTEDYLSDSSNLGWSSTGNAIDAVRPIQKASDNETEPTFTVDATGITVSNRSQDWHSIDLRIDSEGLDLDLLNNSYMIIVRGTVTNPNVAVRLQLPEEPYSTLTNNNLTGTGNVPFELKYVVTSGFDYNRIRINTEWNEDNVHAVYKVTEIEIYSK